jgi:methionyl aminopeptidase
MISIKTPQEIARLKKSGRILAQLLKDITSQSKVGANLLDLENYARAFAKKNGAHPAFLGYKPQGARHPYPAALCTSLNQTVVHGTPRDYILKSGDILKIDAGIVYEGMYTDSAVTIGVGKISSRAKNLLQSTKKALSEAIALMRPGKTLGDIGWAIEHRAHSDGLKVLHALTGHGVGYELHEDPFVYNYGSKGEGAVLKEGMVLAVEPMFSISSNDVIQQADESYASANESLTAHFEHTIVITKKGHEVITL